MWEQQKVRFKDSLEGHKTAISTKDPNYPMAIQYNQPGHKSPSSLKVFALEVEPDHV